MDATNLLPRSWPRGAAVAEALWSRPGAGANVTAAGARLLGHTCRLRARGLPAEPPSGPASCPREWELPYTPPWGRGAV